MTASGFVLLAALVIAGVIAARWLVLGTWELYRRLRRRPWWRA